MTSFPTTRLLPRYPVDLPVKVVFHHGAEKLAVPGRGTDLSRNGMALYAGLILKAGDPIEVEFQVPFRLRVACIIRNRAGYCFGLNSLLFFRLNRCFPRLFPLKTNAKRPL